jgi:alpha,alpha-trehalase
MVGIPGIAYAGSHGFDILLPDGERRRRGEEFDPALDAAERDLRDAVADGVPGSWVDRKRFAVAVHFREMDPALVPELDRRVGEVAARHPELRRTGGKMIFELRPDVAWDKGRALRFLLSVLGLDGADVVPVYVGDDETDEDAFRTLQGDGLGIVVAGDDDDRPTRATLRLPDPSAVEAFLRALAASRPAS